MNNKSPISLRSWNCCNMRSVTAKVGGRKQMTEKRGKHEKEWMRRIHGVRLYAFGACTSCSDSVITKATTA